ncbi:MAG TPA: glycosyltransferase [Candidatus Onthomonas avicola]|nr:glycosyltransferase [Candidatus Onthomonas avicola]
MDIMHAVNLALGLLLALCFGYQVFFLFVPFWKKDTTPRVPERLHRFAVLICARNEEAVIAQLIESIRRQDYPSELVKIFVAADNCTDRTAAIARAAGAIVWERQDSTRVGKGWALEFLLARMEAAGYGPAFDAYLVFDADNLLRADYIRQINRTFSAGCPVVTSYRAAKNYGDSWVSAGCALWFLRGADFLNRARMLLGTSCILSGTGFLVSRAVIERFGGWPCHLLTEDSEFTARLVLADIPIGYCREAVFYDEQPAAFSVSWRQRLRWAKGSLQVLRHYGPALLGKLIRTRHFACFDLLMSITPAVLPLAAGLIARAMAALAVLLAGGALPALAPPQLTPLTLAGALVPTLGLGALLTLTHWRELGSTAGKKLGYLLTFPLFLATFVPISAAALVCQVQWSPIAHTRGLSIQDLCPPSNA